MEEGQNTGGLLGVISKYREIISYIFWGGMTTLVSWVSYSLFELAFQKWDQEFQIFGLGLQLDVFLASLLSWVAAIAFAFVTNKLWVFGSRQWKPQIVIPELLRFLSARIVTGILEVFAVPLLVGMGLDQTVFGVEGMIAKAAVSVAVVVLNYIFSKLFVFRNGREDG